MCTNSLNPKPFSIRFFLPDGTSDGVRIVEKSNWTGVGIVVPRTLFQQSKGRNEFSRTGIYILSGNDEELDTPMLYVGQGDPILARLESHAANKDFWTKASFFVTRDDSLNKAHIGYLESKLIQLAKEAKRATLQNVTTPQTPSLSEPDAADMDSFLSDILAILPLVGIDAFEIPPAPIAQKSLLFLSVKGINAQGYESPQGFVVQAGSTAVTKDKETPSLNPSTSSLRRRLFKEGLLTKEGDFLLLTQNYVFSSSSQAAKALLGRSASGPGEWKDDKGQTLREILLAESNVQEGV